jgi:ribosomal protein S18 acetylase RimI-like enzyme
VVAQRLKKYARDLRSLPNDVAAAWRSDGAAGVTLQLRRRSIDRLGGYVRYIVIEADMLPLQPHDPSDCEIRCFTDADWSLLGDLVPLRLVAIFEAARSAGRICLVAWQGTTAEGYIWLSPSVEERHENFALELPADAIYLWQIQVTRSARRRGVGAALIRAAFHLAAERGVRRSWMITRRDNIAAQRTIAAVSSCRVLGTLSRVKVAAWMRSSFVRFPEPFQLRPGSEV